MDTNFDFLLQNLNNHTNKQIENFKYTEDNSKLTGKYDGYTIYINDKFEVSFDEKTDNEEIKVEKGEQYLYTYTGDYQEFQAKKAGYYKIECFGADGGRARADGALSGKGGVGGYTSGAIYLQKDEKIYVYVGEKGEDAISYKDVEGGYNGGGIGTWDRADDDASGAGGGATDIRLVNGEWDNFDSLKSRIMVAGGGARNKLVCYC